MPQATLLVLKARAPVARMVSMMASHLKQRLQVLYLVIGNEGFVHKVRQQHMADFFDNLFFHGHGPPVYDVREASPTPSPCATSWRVEVCPIHSPNVRSRGLLSAPWQDLCPCLGPRIIVARRQG